MVTSEGGKWMEGDDEEEVEGKGGGGENSCSVPKKQAKHYCWFDSCFFCRVLEDFAAVCARPHYLEYSVHLPFAVTIPDFRPDPNGDSSRDVQEDGFAAVLGHTQWVSVRCIWKLPVVFLLCIIWEIIWMVSCLLCSLALSGTECPRLLFCSWPICIYPPPPHTHTGDCKGLSQRRMS